jgi:copper chaperone CopZ
MPTPVETLTKSHSDSAVTLSRYHVSGMHCNSCAHSIENGLKSIPGVATARVNFIHAEALVQSSLPLEAAAINQVIQQLGPYQLSPLTVNDSPMGQQHEIDSFANAEPEVKRGFFETYKPVLLAFGFIALVVGSVHGFRASFNWGHAMMDFMGGFFVVFSFFKMLDVPAFARAFQRYDIIAKRIPAYGLVYPFIELGLGLAYLTQIHPVATHWANLLVMGVGTIGVLQQVLAGNRIQCACLGTVFNLPMSTLTIIENGLMLVMGAVMLLH